MYEKLNNRRESKIELEKNENEQLQDNNLQTCSTSCVSKVNYTLPKYHNNVSPTIDKLMRMISMPSLITFEDSSSNVSTPTNCISSFHYCCGDNENFTVSIMAKEHLDICFSSPKRFVSTYKKDSAEDRTQSRTKEIDSLFSQIAQEPVSGWQEITDSLPDANSKVKEIPRYIILQCFEKESK